MHKGKNTANVYLSEITVGELLEILGVRFTLSGFLREVSAVVAKDAGLREKVLGRLDAEERRRRGL